MVNNYSLSSKLCKNNRSLFQQLLFSFILSRGRTLLAALDFLAINGYLAEAMDRLVSESVRSQYKNALEINFRMMRIIVTSNKPKISQFKFENSVKLW